MLLTCTLNLHTYIVKVSKGAKNILAHKRREEKAGYFAIIVLQMFCYYSIHGMWLYLMVLWVGLQYVMW